jgi:hypothetical protein
LIFGLLLVLLRLVQWAFTVVLVCFAAFFLLGGGGCISLRRGREVTGG